MNTATSKLLAIVVCLASPPSAWAKLGDFEVADGYMNPFSTRVWTYNSLWTLDGGVIGDNYVAQHGYNAGFAMTTPFALVVRNDNPASNYRFSYDFQPVDLGGLNPASLGSARIAIAFDVCSTVAQNSQTANGAAMMTMRFGGSATAPGVSLGFSDANKLMFSNAAGVLTEFTGYTLNGSGWDRVTLELDFASDTYDLSVASMTGNGISGSSTYTPVTTYSVVTGMPFTNALASMTKLRFETFTDPEDGMGWHKMFLDNFTASAVPEPTAAGLAAVAALGLPRRRRS